MVEQVAHCTTLGGIFPNRYCRFVYIITCVLQIEEKNTVLTKSVCYEFQDKWK